MSKANEHNQSDNDRTAAQKWNIEEPGDNVRSEVTIRRGADYDLEEVQQSCREI